MSDGDIMMYIFLFFVGIVVAILSSPFIITWAVFAFIAYIISGGKLNRQWWNKTYHKIKDTMSSEFWTFLAIFVICVDMVLVSGGFIRYRMNNNIRQGVLQPLTWDTVGTLSIQKDLLHNFWRWNYEAPDHDLIVTQMCPTWFGHDAVVKINEQVQATTDGKFLTNLWEYELKDNTGNMVYKVKASDGNAIITNYLHLSLSVVILTPEDEVVAYVEGSAFIIDDFVMKAADGTPLIKFHRNKFNLDAWTWEIESLSTKAQDIFPPVYAAALAGHHAFTDKNVFSMKDNTDTCNKFIQYAWFTSIVCGCMAAFAFLLCLTKISFKGCCRKTEVVDNITSMPYHISVKVENPQR